MTGWLIAAGVTVGLLLLLLMPVRLRVGYNETLTAELRYLFLRFKLTGRKPKPEPEKKTDTAKKAKKPSLLQQIRDLERSLEVDSLPAAIGKITALLKESLGKAAWLLKRSTLSRLELTVLVGGEDAAGAAMTYGTLCAAVYPLVSWGTGLFRRVRRQQVEVRCCFDRPDIRAKAAVWISVTPLGALRAALGLVWAFIKMQKKAETKEVSVT